MTETGKKISNKEKEYTMMLMMNGPTKEIGSEI